MGLCILYASSASVLTASALNPPVNYANHFDDYFLARCPFFLEESRCTKLQSPTSEPSLESVRTDGVDFAGLP